MPDIVKYIDLIVAALIPIMFGHIGKQLTELRNTRKQHQAAYDASMAEIAELKTQNKEIIKMIEEWQMRASRYRIIRFDDEEQSGITHSVDHWQQILEDIDIYEKFCQSHPDFVNNKGKGAMTRILTTHNQQQSNNI